MEADPDMSNFSWLQEALAQLFLARKCMAYRWGGGRAEVASGVPAGRPAGRSLQPVHVFLRTPAPCARPCARPWCPPAPPPSRRRACRARLVPPPTFACFMFGQHLWLVDSPHLMPTCPKHPSLHPPQLHLCLLHVWAGHVPGGLQRAGQRHQPGAVRGQAGAAGGGGGAAQVRGGGALCAQRACLGSEGGSAQQGQLEAEVGRRRCGAAGGPARVSGVFRAGSKAARRIESSPPAAELLPACGCRAWVPASPRASLCPAPAPPCARAAS